MPCSSRSLTKWIFNAFTSHQTGDAIFHLLDLYFVTYCPLPLAISLTIRSHDGKPLTLTNLIQEWIYFDSSYDWQESGEHNSKSGHKQKVARNVAKTHKKSCLKMRRPRLRNDATTTTVISATDAAWRWPPLLMPRIQNHWAQNKGFSDPASVHHFI